MAAVTTHWLGTGASFALPQTVPLNAFDHVASVYVRQVLFYPRALDPQRVRESLERALLAHPVLVGRLRRGHDGRLEVLVAGQGVRFEVVHSARRWPWSGRPSIVDTAPFMPRLPMRIVDRDAPMLVVRVTQFDGGGSALCICQSHALRDGFGSSLFQTNWARAAAGEPLDPVSDDRLAIERLAPHARPAVCEQGVQQVSRARLLWTYARLLAGKRNLQTRAVRIEQEAWDELHARAGGRSQLTRTTALIAELWRVLAPARKPGGSTTMTVIVDSRSRVDGALPERLFANACVTVSTKAAADAALEPCAQAIKKAIASVNADSVGAEARHLRDLIVRPEPLPALPHSIGELFQGALMFNSWLSSSCYGLDLGSGPPVWLELPKGPLPGFIVALPSPQGRGGAELRVTLPRREWRRLDERARSTVGEDRKTLKTLRLDWTHT